MLHDVGFLETAVELYGLTTICFAVGVGLNFFVWPLRGVPIGVFFNCFTIPIGVYEDTQQAYVLHTNHLLVWRDCIFVLRLPAQPFSWLVSEADSLQFISMK